MSDKNEQEWHEHVEGQIVNAECKIEDAIRACEHQELRSELVGLYRRIIGIQYRYYDDTPGVDTDLTDDDDDDDDLLDIDDVEFIDDNGIVRLGMFDPNEWVDDDDEYVGTEPGDHNDVNSSADDLMGDDDDDVEITDEMKEEMEEMSRKAVEDNINTTVKMYGAGSTDPADEIECNLKTCDCESSESFGDYNASDVMDADDLNERIHNIVEDSKDD